ncbi:MAG: polysaccharide deacetylase [Chloroflexi bacterium]|nr:polysaccharide deacetylase [Chloroflexota bacterium]
MPNSTICLSFDFDAMSVWFGYKTVGPAMLSRGEYGARVGIYRVLDLLRQYQLPATFFIPGHTIESFPEPVEAVLAAGHEIGHHSWSHIDPGQQTLEEERQDMERALQALGRLGVKPLGYRSPSDDFSPSTATLLEEYGFLYDSSLMADDFRPYHPHIGDQVSAISPLVRGREAYFWELPMCFEFDDWPHFQFNFVPYRNGTSAPGKVLDIWQNEFDWMHSHIDSGILTVCMHPQVIGRAHRIAMLEQFIQHCQAAGDVKFELMGDMIVKLAAS